MVSSEIDIAVKLIEKIIKEKKLFGKRSFVLFCSKKIKGVKSSEVCFSASEAAKFYSITNGTMRTYISNIKSGKRKRNPNRNFFPINPIEILIKVIPKLMELKDHRGLINKLKEAGVV